MNVVLRYADGEYSLERFGTCTGPERYRVPTESEWMDHAIDVQEHVVEQYAALVAAWSVMQDVLRAHDRVS